VLILTRKAGESLILGDNIEITILEIRGKQIRLGIKAPEDIQVFREEVYRRIKGENLQASGVQMTDFSEGARLWRQKKGDES
jgi:carbon storage regulator